MRKDVIVAINLQDNYFHSSGSSFLGEKALPVLQEIKDGLASANPDRFEIVYTRDVRPPADPFYGHQKTQCVVGTSDINMVKGLTGAKSYVINAPKPSAAWGTSLAYEITRNEPSMVYLVGAETHSAILFTAAELRYRGIPVCVPEGLTVSKDEYMYNAAIALMSDVLGVEVMGGTWIRS